MDRIELLDDNLVNKIAAGEVVERPASVVKELVENAIDAGATKITVDIQEGGRKRILISDNGCGMSANDAKKSILRHSTSKIKTVEDLFKLSTMGFRGEALASISSVCRFTLMTCEQGSNDGVRIQMSGDGEVVASPWQSSGGTTIICDELFFNVPVRKKFLKSTGSEYGAIFELVQALALANHGIDFTLIHNGKETLRAPAIEQNSDTALEHSLRKRFSHVMKGDAGLGMLYVQAKSQWASMVALVSAPGVERGTSKDMFLFVNGRWVRDKSLRFAVLRGYHSHLLRGRYPVVALFLTVDSGLVDVNVYPAKTEVRLQYTQEIHDMVAEAIRTTIRRADWAGVPSGKGSPFSSDGPPITALADGAPKTKPLAGMANSGFTHSSVSRWRDVTPEFPRFRDNVKTTDKIVGIDKDWINDLPHNLCVQDSSVNGELIPWKELQFMGSIANCYLLFAHGSGETASRLLVLDQHAFHERVIYERLTRDQGLLKSSQSLLVPECVYLGPQATAVLNELKATLVENGFIFECLDDSNIEVRAVPVLLSQADLPTLFASMAEQGTKSSKIDSLVILHDLLSTFACHAAVRAGEPIGEDELKILVKEASQVDFYHNCPHGRRVFRWWEASQIARWFDR